MTTSSGKVEKNAQLLIGPYMFVVLCAMYSIEWFPSIKKCTASCKQMTLMIANHMTPFCFHHVPNIPVLLHSLPEYICSVFQYYGTLLDFQAALRVFLPSRHG